jgi:hypothetical protein
MFPRTSNSVRDAAFRWLATAGARYKIYREHYGDIASQVIHADIELLANAHAAELDQERLTPDNEQAFFEARGYQLEYRPTLLIFRRNQLRFAREKIDGADWMFRFGLFVAIHIRNKGDAVTAERLFDGR